MSYQAIGAALALDGISGPQRLVAFSLASYTNREHRAWPGTPAAAQRAGLARGRFLAVREELVRAGLVVVEDARGGRGCASTVRLRFADGDRVEGEINAPLFEVALTRTRLRGGGRLLVAVMAALADSEGRVSGVSAGELAAAAGLTATSYRRARNVLLEAGEARLDSGAGGRGNLNQWTLLLPDPAAGSASRTRVPPPTGVRPLLASLEPPAAGQRDEARDQIDLERAEGEAVEAGKGAAVRTVSAEKGAAARTVSVAKGAVTETVSGGKGAAAGTVSAERAPEREPETPPPSARAGREPGNLRTFPPDPPQGGSPDRISVLEEYVSDRGRRRQRRIEVNFAELAGRYREPSGIDEEAWAAIRGELCRVVGESTFEVWLEPLSLRAVDRSGALLISAPAPTRAWVGNRFQRLLARISLSTGRDVRLVDDREQLLLDALLPTRPAGPAGVESSIPHTFIDRRTDHQEAV